MVFEKKGPGGCEIDLASRQVVREIAPGKGRTFYGHGTFTADRQALLAVEIDAATRQGRMVIRDPSDLKVLGEFPTHGDDPHDCLLTDGGKVLVITNGGKPGGEAPGVTFVDVASHRLLEKVRPGADALNTGHVALHNIAVVNDSGRIINPQSVRGQVIGSIVHTLGNTLFERMGYDEQAQPLTTTFAEYLLPTAPEIPTVDVTLLEFPGTNNPLGVKGAGETACIPVPGAVVSAIEHALEPIGVELDEFPLSPARLFDASGVLKSRTAAPSSSMKSATCPSTFKPSCCASCRKANSNILAAAARSGSTSGYWPPPIATWSRRSARALSALTCTTDSTSFLSPCRRYASAATTFRSWSSTL